MYKAKLCSFAMVCAIGLVGLSPITVYASETKTESVTPSEKNQKDKRAAFDTAMKNANDKWNQLTAKQKTEVYLLIEDEMNSEFKLMDKFVELGIFQKQDADKYKIHMMQKLKRIKETGEFPLMKQKSSKSK